MTKLLLVEDNEMNRDMLSRRLERKGFEVVMAEDGREGVAMALAELPDLILMDMNMPVLNGWDATREIKAAPQTASIPVIALTAHAMSGDREKGMAAGCDDYDTKPVEFERLLGKINALLKFESREGDAVSAASSDAASAMPPLQIDGLNYASGLRRAGGDEKFYRQLLTRFATDFGNASTVFAGLIANANWVEAERQAHTLKGLAGSLGANALVTPATELEKFCKAGQGEQAAAALAQLSPLLTSLLDKLNAHLHVPKPAIAETPYPASLPPNCLPRLRKLLAEGDSEATELWAEHQAAFAAVLPLQIAERVTVAIENFDLDAALALLPAESSTTAS